MFSFHSMLNFSHQNCSVMLDFRSLACASSQGMGTSQPANPPKFQVGWQHKEAFQVSSMLFMVSKKQTKAVHLSSCVYRSK